jgi:hypothetical protein
VVLAIEGTIGHQLGSAVGGGPLRNVRPDDLAERWRITAMAAQRLHEHGNPGLMLDNQCQHDVIEVGSVIPTITACEVHDLFVGSLVAVIAPIDMQAGAIEMRKTRG